MSFNSFGNRDDTSIKLRAQNQKILSKEQTKLLEMETEKMAERLMELKIAMSREKEEREKTFRGGGFWSSGQEGSLGSYPKEVITKPVKPKEQNPKQKITWLKNEPIVLPERPKGPCTIACIAERKLPIEKSGSLKFKGRRCGQCEEKAAHVSCTECGEDYCAACFTAFHLKGALKKHRSTPIGSGSLRTPRADVKRVPTDDYKENIQQTFGDRKNEKISASAVTDSDLRRLGNVSKGDLKEMTASSKSAPPVQRQGNFSDEGGSLLEGTFDPIANQRQFQEALMEWRQGGKATENGENKPAQAKTPRADVSVETATEGIVRQPIDIKFSSHSLSYAERLMLKKHRRMELGTPLSPPSPSFASAANEVPPSDPITDRKDQTHRLSDQNMFQGDDADAFSEDGRRSRLSAADSEGSYNRKALDGFLASSRSQLNDSVMADSSRLRNDFGQVSPANRKACSARLPSDRQKVLPAARIRPDESKLSIVELTKPLSKKDILGLERSTTYHVMEIPDPVCARTTPKQPANRRISSRPKVRKDAFLSASGSLDLSIQPRPPRKPLVVTQTSVEAFDAPRKVSSSSKDTSVSMKDSLNRKPNSGNLSSQDKLNTSKTGLNSAKTSTVKPVTSRLKQKGGNDAVELAESVSGVEDEHVTDSQTSSRAEKVPGSRATSKLGKDAKQGRFDGPKTDSAMNPCIKPRVASRPGSQLASRQNLRPKSQTESRPSSRLASYRDGCLTKVASEALRSVARLAGASATSQQTDLGAYFTMAVHPDRREVMTPVSSRLNSARPNGRWKVSNTLYQMAPRSWKPDASLVETVSEDQVKQIVKEGQHLTMEAATETSIPKATMLNWSLSQGLSSSNSPENSNSRVAAEELESSDRKKESSDLEVSFKNVTHSEANSNLKTELKSLPKEEALNDLKLNFVQGHSVTPNMMIPARFRRLGSSTTGRESQSGSRTDRESQSGSRTGRESQSGSRTGRESQMIVYDADELSIYDEQDFAEQQRENDAEAMKRIDWEIASETGLMAADISVMHSEYEVSDKVDFVKLNKSSDDNFSPTFHKLRESQLMSDFEEMEAKIMDNYEEEVKALK